MTGKTPPELIAAVLTGSGRGAVATIALAGKLELLDGLFHPRNGKSAVRQTINRICFGHWFIAASHPKTGDDDTPSMQHFDVQPGEEVVFCRVAEQRAELYCHGGAAAQACILQDLAQAGTHILPSSEFISITSNPISAEGEFTLSRAPTTRTAKILLQQYTLFPDALRRLKALTCPQRQQQLDEMLAWAEFGLHLTQPWKLVLTGAPNVGKSTLMNALVGYQRAIVFDQPGTTRDVLTAETAIDGWPVQLTDTAGLRTTHDPLEAAGIQQAHQQLSTADLVLHVREAGGQNFSDEPELAPPQRRLVVWNKVDCVPHFTTVPASEQVVVSALQQTGIKDLLQRIAQELVPQLPPENLAIPCSPQQVYLLQQLRSF